MVGFFNDRTSAPTFIFYESPTATFHPYAGGDRFSSAWCVPPFIAVSNASIIYLYIVDLWQRHIMTWIGNSPSIKFIHGDMAYHKVGLELLYTLTFTCSGYEGLLTYTGFSLYQIGNLDFSILAFDFSHSTQSGVHVGSSIGSIDFDYLCPFLYTYLHHGKSPRSIYRYALLR